MAKVGSRARALLPPNAALDHEPENENGVVYLFSTLARTKFGLRIDRIQAAFPDCIAYRDGRRIRIEFEYRSRNFAAHRHDPAGCDWIVCWIHDWAAVPASLRVVELRKEFGLGFNVWFQPVRGSYKEDIQTRKAAEHWSVPPQASEGDLILFYLTSPESRVSDIFRVSGPVTYRDAGWKAGRDWMAPIARVASLKAPLHLSQMKAHKVLSRAGFVRGSMQGRYRASEYWPELYRHIVATNPSVQKVLRRFGPDRV
jgi:hypothetical protein